MDLYGLLALAWTVLFVGVRYVGAIRAGRQTAQVQTPVIAPSDGAPLPQPRTGSVATGITVVGLLAVAVWLTRKALANRR